MSSFPSLPWRTSRHSSHSHDLDNLINVSLCPRDILTFQFYYNIVWRDMEHVDILQNIALVHYIDDIMLIGSISVVQGGASVSPQCSMILSMVFCSSIVVSCSFCEKKWSQKQFILPSWWHHFPQNSTFTILIWDALYYIPISIWVCFWIVSVSLGCLSIHQHYTLLTLEAL